MPASPLLNRISNKLEKIITLTGAANFGQNASACTIYTITGSIWLVGLFVRATTVPVSAGGGTLALGVTGNTGALIPATTATSILVGDTWHDASPEVGCAPCIVNQVINAANIIMTTATADVTAGVFEFELFWLPVSNNGLAA